MDKSIELRTFITSLLRDSLDGVIASELENLEKIQEIKNSVLLTNEEFADKFLTPEEIRGQILFTFPTDKVNVSSIDIGMEYRAETATTNEYPPIKKELEYEITPEDYTIKDRKYYISQQGYDHLYIAIKNKYTQEKRILIKQLLYKGIPNLYVDKGEVTSKIYVKPTSPDEIFNGYENGLVYKCYKQGNSDEDKPYAKGICSHFNYSQTIFEGANMIVFEGFLHIKTSDYYHFSLCTNEKCKVELNNQILLTTNKADHENTLYLYKGMYSFKLKCSYHGEDNLVALYYKPYEEGLCKMIQPSDFYYKLDSKSTSVIRYKNKFVKIDVVLPSLQDEMDNGLGELKLFYHFVHE